MSHAEWELFFTIVATIGIGALGARLAWSIWVGRAISPVPFAVPLAVALLTASFFAISQSTGPAVMVASAVSQPGAAPAPVHEIQVEEHGERATIRGIRGTQQTSTVWAVLEDPRTGTLWLQGPAQSDSASWSLEIVIGSGASDEPLPYRATVVAMPQGSDAAWQASTGGRTWLSVAGLPPGDLWLAPTMTLWSRGGQGA